MNRRISVLAVVMLTTVVRAGDGPAPVRDRADLRDPVDKIVDGRLAEWVSLYKEMHASPELSLMEEKSASRIARLFREAGLDVTPNFGGHGVVGLLKNGDGPVLLVRGDMDALPVTEETGLPYASKIRIEQDDGSHVGVMHACGHDVHQTVLVATAQVLVGLKDRWRGTIVFVAQPAEEIGRGAMMMIDAGLFTKYPKPAACIALHVAHDLEAGKVGITSGWHAANVDSVDIRIFGKGGHGAYPHQTADPIVAAAQVITALQTIVSRRVNPIESAVVTVGSIHGGAKHNIIPGEVELKLTVRSYKDDVRRQVLDSIRQVTIDTCKAMGLPREPEVKIREDEFTPAGYNDPALTSAASDLFRSLLGKGNVLECPPSMGGEDFGQYGKVAGVPSFMFGLGTVSAEQMAASKKTGGPLLPAIHGSRFAPQPEPTVRTGVRAMCALALSLLGEPR